MFSARRCFIVACVCLAQSAVVADDIKQQDLEFYNSKVLPLLKTHCYECHSHSTGKARGGLVLDSKASLLKGGDSGPAIELGKVDASLLVKAIRFESLEMEMPPEGKLDDKVIETLVEWVRRGAPAPETTPLPNHGNGIAERDQSKNAVQEHWAFSTLSTPHLPPAISEGTDVIDYLVEKSRESANVTAVPLADERTVLQRLYSDLIGLPPTVEELDVLVGDQSLSLEMMVNHILEKLEFGERWGRHWLDVARYADSNGCSIESNNTYDNAWRYRDYVIAALNEDKAYDQFVVEQIAGDLLDHVSDTQRCEQLIATGFLLLGPKAFGTGFAQLEMDVIDEQIDTVGKAMLGMSLGCARCHDHKFDPVSTQDYYALAGIFGSTQSVAPTKGWRQGKSWNRVELPILTDDATSTLKKAYEQTKAAAESGDLIKDAEAKVAEAKKQLQQKRTESSDDVDAIAKMEQLLKSAKLELANARNMKKVLPVISPVPVAMAVSEKEKILDQAVRIRGEIGNQGDVVPRRLIPLFEDSNLELFTVPQNQSGRMQLARWLVDPENGAGRLLARVAVNRIWGHLFSRPLVDSADNFGMTGAKPSHPELLDYLAIRYIHSGWSTKSLIRDIVLTKTYRLAAQEHIANSAIDPENQLLWRWQPKRIDVEVLRDSMLALSGKLDRRRGGKTLQHLGLVSLGGDHLVLDVPSPYQRRSVYTPIYRDTVGLTDSVDASMGMLSTFDFADPNLMAGARSQTVVPAQALFLMNSEFVHEQASALAETILREESIIEGRLQQLYKTVYGRAPSTAEVEQLKQYITSFAAETTTASNADQQSNSDSELLAWTSLCQSLFGSNEFLFLD